MGLFKRREPVQVEMQHPVAEPSWALTALNDELRAVDEVLAGHSVQPERDWQKINHLLDERLAVTELLPVPVIPGRTS